MKNIEEKHLHIATIIICGLLVVLAFLIIIPIAVLMGSLNGECLLYADSVDYGAKSTCGYPIAVATLFQIIYGAARLVVVLLPLLGISLPDILSPTRLSIPCAVVDAIACLLTLVSGGIVSHGFSSMCSNIFFPRSDRCGSVGIYIVADDSFLDNYHQCLTVAEIGVWPSWLLWILLVVVDVFTLHKAGVLQLPSSLPFSLPGFLTRNSSAAPAQNTSQTAVSATTTSGQPGRVATARTQFSPVEGGGSRTPPPKRPVPPRPPDVPAVTKPLIKPEERSDDEMDLGQGDSKRPARPIYRRTVAPT